MRIICQTEIASIFGVTARTITEWQAGGMPLAVQGGPGVPGEYDSAACIQWLVQREVRKVQSESPKDRVLRLQAENMEMDLGLRRGHLIEAASAEPAMRAAIVSARERIRGDPARIAARLEGLDRAERETLLRELFDEVLTKLAGWQQVGGEDDDQGAHGCAE